MARTVIEEMDGITVTARYHQHQRDYLVYTSITGKKSVACVMRRPERPRTSEWGVAWRSGDTTFHPTLSSALYAIGAHIKGA